MTSNHQYKEAYVWIWLPGEVEPVVAGRLEADGGLLHFNYGQSYLDRGNAIPIYGPELPLKEGVLRLKAGLLMPGSIRDAAPDAWGRRSLLNRVFGNQLNEKLIDDPGELFYLLESGSDRTGALDFQLSATEYVPRTQQPASLDDLVRAAEHIEKGTQLPPELHQAISYGTSIGGARPKAQIEHDGKKYIAKFSSTTDLYSVVKAEYIAMHLADLAGMNVAEVELKESANKDVLIVERFDREPIEQGWLRKSMVSALTILELDEMMAKYASYEDLAEKTRHQFRNPSEELRELFSRMVFNVLCGNTDDHARNHAAFWDGDMLSLTRAYDICPQARTGNEASQAMLIKNENRMSQINTCLAAAANFQLSKEDGTQIVERQIQKIGEHWDGVCADASISEVDQAMLSSRQFLNTYAFEGLDKDTEYLKNLADEVRDEIKT